MFEQLKMGKQSIDNETGEHSSAIDSEHSKYLNSHLPHKVGFQAI